MEEEHPWLLCSDDEYHQENALNEHDRHWSNKFRGLKAYTIGRWQQPFSNILLWALPFHVVLLIINLVIASGYFLDGRHSPSTPNRVYSPVDQAIIYTTKLTSTLYNDTVNPFLHRLDQSEDLWREYTKNNFIRITSEEMRLLNRSGASIMLTDGSGDYMVSLDVYHQLHCLYYLRIFIERGPPRTVGITPIDHAYHCIEHLRQVIQCHGDTAIMTYTWRPNDPTPWTRFEMEHTCVDWQALDDWTTSRRLPEDFRTSLVKNPYLDT